MTSPAGQARWDGSLHCLFMMIWVHIERRYWGATCRGVKEKEDGRTGFYPLLNSYCFAPK